MLFIASFRVYMPFNATFIAFHRNALACEVLQPLGSVLETHILQHVAGQVYLDEVAEQAQL